MLRASHPLVSPFPIPLPYMPSLSTPSMLVKSNLFTIHCGMPACDKKIWALNVHT